MQFKLTNWGELTTLQLIFFFKWNILTTKSFLYLFVCACYIFETDQGVVFLSNIWGCYKKYKIVVYIKFLKRKSHFCEKLQAIVKLCKNHISLNSFSIYELKLEKVNLRFWELKFREIKKYCSHNQGNKYDEK